MSLFTKLANDAFSPVDAAGNKRSVENLDAQRWGTEVERLFAAFQAGSGIIFPDLATANASLDYDANQMAWIMGDDAPGVYRKVGASGSGSWVRLGDLPYSMIPLTNAGAGTPDAIVATSALPVPVTPGATLFTVNIVAANTGPVTINGKPLRTNSGNEIVPGGLTAGSISAFLDLGDHYRLLSDQASASIVAAAEDWAIQADERADDAENAADRAEGFAAMLSADKIKFKTVPLLLADEMMSYTADPGKVQVGPGDIIPAGGFRYEVAASGASGPDIVENANGVKLKAVFDVFGLDPAQLGAPNNGVDDDAPFVERALQISHGVVLSGTVVLASVIGIPDQTIYAPTAYEITGYGATIILDGAAAGDAIFTSASAKASPESTDNLYVGKVNFNGGSYNQRSPSVLINGDRVYNVNISINAHAITSVIKSYRPKGSGGGSEYPNGYLQSVNIANCQFSSITKIVDAKKALNFNWYENFCEACQAGIYIDGPGGATVTGFNMVGGLFEGGGLAVRLGSVHGGQIDGVYFENNPVGDTITDKCYIKIGHSGGTRSFAFRISNIGAYPSTAQRNDADFYVFKDDASVPGTSVDDCYTNGVRFWQPGKVRNQKGNIVGNQSAAAQLATRAPLPAQEAGVSFLARSALSPLSVINDAGKIRVAMFNVENLKAAFAATSSGRDASGTIYSNLRAMTAGQIVTGGAMAVIDFVAMGSSINVSSGALDEVYVGFSLRSFTQIPAGQTIETTYSNLTREHWTAPALTVTKSGDIYSLWVGAFATGANLPGYGAVTQMAIEVTTQVNGMRHFSRDWAPLVLATV